MSSHEPGCWCWSNPLQCAVHRIESPKSVDPSAKPWAAIGRGFMGTYSTREEAEAVVRLNRSGAVYSKVAAADQEGR